MDGAKLTAEEIPHVRETEAHGQIDGVSLRSPWDGSRGEYQCNVHRNAVYQSSVLARLWSIHQYWRGIRKRWNDSA